MSPNHDEKFRMMLENLIGFATMHGRDMHKDPDAWGKEIREKHLALVTYVESRMAPPASEHGGRCEACGGSGDGVEFANATEDCAVCGGTGAAPGGGR